MTRYLSSVLFDESGLHAMHPPSMARVFVQMRQHAEGVPVELRSEAITRRAPQVMETLAVIPIHGVITKRESMWSELLGGTTLDGLSVQLAQARADDSVRGVVLHVDSPGGGVYGVDEVAAQIAELATHKPVVAYVDGLGASAAYWLASNATRIVMAPSSEVGSVGVYALHFDESGALAQAGVVPTLIKAGTYKAEGNPYFPLADEDRAALHARIGTHYERFVARVAKGRGVPTSLVRDGAPFGEGRVLDASQATPAKANTRDKATGYMADAIGGWSDVVRIATTDARARTTTPAPATRSRSDELLRLELALADVAL
jgi:signal peptide peptidase SppA